MLINDNLKLISVIVPVFNEKEIVVKFHNQLLSVLISLPNSFEIIYVDDGSNDGSSEVLDSLTKNDSRIEIIHLSRNFGHQSALTCGMEYSLGDIIITMDGDGQHPPELIPEMLDIFENGYQIVLTQRQVNSESFSFKNITSKAFYKIINIISKQKITPESADFRLLSRKAANSINNLKEYHRFLRGMVSWIGYKTIILPYVPSERMGGKSKYTIKKMIQLASDALFSFSLLPLKIGFGIGGMFFLLAFVEVIYIGILWMSAKQVNLAPGWSSLMFVILILGGTLTIIISIIGMYVGHIYQEVKKRPTYIIDEIVTQKLQSENMGTK